MRFRLYCGMVRNNEWYNYTEVQPLLGGILAMLDGAEMTGASRILNLVKGSIKSLYTEDGKEFELRPNDYEDITIHDSWKIGLEQIKLKTGTDYPVIPESFYCNRCSQPKREQYTNVNESWVKLIEDGFLDEIFLENSDMTFDIELPEPIVLQGSKNFVGGEFSTITMRHLTIGDMLKIHRNPDSMSSQANMIRASWDAAMVKIHGLSDRDFNRIMTIPGQSFAGKYLSSDVNQEAINDALDDNIVGIDASRRVIYCKNCGNPLRGEMDFTNFFSPLLPKKQNRVR